MLVVIFYIFFYIKLCKIRQAVGATPSQEMTSPDSAAIGGMVPAPARTAVAVRSSRLGLRYLQSSRAGIGRSESHRTCLTLRQFDGSEFLCAPFKAVS